MTAPAAPTSSTPAASETAQGSPAQTGASVQAAPAGQASGSRSTETEQAARGPDYFRQAFARVRGYTQSGADTPAPQAPPASSRSGQDAKPPASPTHDDAPAAAPRSSASSTTLAARSNPPAPDGGVFLTQQELDRRVQSEVDRRIAKQQQEDQARAQQEALRRLRKEDPFEYVRTIEEQEARGVQEQARTQEALNLLQQQIHHYDRGILDPVVGALPERTRQKILSEVNEEGIPGRAKIAAASLKELRSIWTAEGRDSARASLMKDQTFIKEVLARYGGQAVEPEVVAPLPPNGRSNRPVTENDAINAWMRTTVRERA